jgi:N-acetylneuraminic acid mutarotase
VVNGKIYALGGWQKGVVISPSPVEEYDPVADKWTKKPDMPGAACGLCAGVVKVVDERIYAIGGWDGEDYVSSVREYNPVTGVWTELGDMLTPRAYLSASVVDGKIYAIGGSGEGIKLSTVEEYDPVKDKWTKKVDMAFARYGLCTSVVNGKIYAIGGARGIPDEALSAVEEYDTGFASKSVEATGKLPAKWGEMKQY